MPASASLRSLGAATPGRLPSTAQQRQQSQQRGKLPSFLNIAAYASTARARRPSSDYDDEGSGGARHHHRRHRYHRRHYHHRHHAHRHVAGWPGQSDDYDSSRDPSAASHSRPMVSSSATFLNLAAMDILPNDVADHWSGVE